MSGNGTCPMHAVVEEKFKRYDQHCDEADKPDTGHRDRLLKAEVNIKTLSTSVKELKSAVFYAAIAGGIIGAFFGQLCPWLINSIGSKLAGA